MEDHQTPWKGRRSTSTTWEEELLVGRRKEGLKASLLCDLSSIMFNRSWPSLRGKKPWGGSAATIVLQCVVNAWWSLALKERAKEKSLNLARRGEDATPEGLIFLTCFVLSFHFLSICPRESESCFLSS